MNTSSKGPLPLLLALFLFQISATLAISARFLEPDLPWPAWTILKTAAVPFLMAGGLATALSPPALRRTGAVGAILVVGLLLLP
jgi:hypothetical protein